MTGHVSDSDRGRSDSRRNVYQYEYVQGQEYIVMSETRTQIAEEHESKYRLLHYHTMQCPPLHPNSTIPSLVDPQGPFNQDHRTYFTHADILTRAYRLLRKKILRI